MKTQIHVLLTVLSVVVIGFSLLSAEPEAKPVLVFKGFAHSPTNAAEVAHFELRNETSGAIWLCYSGEEFPLRAPFLTRPVTAETNAANTLQTNVYSLRVGSFFTCGEKVLPGDKLRLEFPLVSSEPAEQVSISYYVGNFEDGNDFLNSLETPVSEYTATWRDAGTYYVGKVKKRNIERYEVWCPQRVSFQAATSSSPTVHRRESERGAK